MDRVYLYEASRIGKFRNTENGPVVPGTGEAGMCVCGGKGGGRRGVTV